MTTDAQIEQEMNDKGLTATRVKVDEIEALYNSLIVKTHVFEGTTTTVALAILPNGFTVAMAKSACISPENFDADIGRRIATERALEKARKALWDFEGYRLKASL